MVFDDMKAPTLAHPSAFIPLVMSFAALAMTLSHAAIFGRVHESDEGTLAHIFQMLLILQVPVAAYFALKWLAKFPARALGILAVQAGAALTAIAVVIAVGYA